MIRPLPPLPPARNEGLVLIEVMIAVILLALLIVPLAGIIQSIADTADEIRGRDTGYSGSRGNPPPGDAWEWGEAVWMAWWRPGPTLHVQAESGQDDERLLGLWADGWLLGEWEPSEDGAVQIGASVWGSSAGRELVARVRVVDGAWGPAWRLVVPEADGKTVPSGPADGGGGRTVIHAPSLGNPAFALSETESSLKAIPLGLPFFLPSSGSGLGEIGLDGREQSWKTEASRDLDIFF